MNRVTNVLIVGVGGQGTLLASRVIAGAAVRRGYDVKVSEIHGMAQRGGSVVSQVRFGDKVYSPIIKKGEADVILAFEKLEAARYLDYLRRDGLIVVNDERIDPLPVMSGEARYPEELEKKIEALVSRSVVVDAGDIAKRCGNAKAANMVMVGIMSKTMDINEEEWREAVAAQVRPQVLEVNLKAFEAGRNFMEGKAIEI